eukprot:TRINITY_DN20849_c0_g1_i1.p1 TRINITY_DN20849_c0_g1~~TRINITY_DN20849_c0_g1_i1.p1  ORF type:complete len:554 (-),score=26.06 TRINITY_DN20849_c0_g1_i1:53-1714(-)
MSQAKPIVDISLNQWLCIPACTLHRNIRLIAAANPESKRTYLIHQDLSVEPISHALTLFHVAILRQDFPAVELLLKLGINPHYPTALTGFMLASLVFRRAADAVVAHKLIQFETELEEICFFGAEQDTPFTFPTHLVEDYDPATWHFAAHYAASGGHLNVLKCIKAILPENQLWFQEPVSCMEITPLIAAACNGQLPVVQWLITDCGVKADGCDKRGRTALLWAALVGHLPVVAWLLSSGSSSADESDTRNNTALLQAALGGHTDIIKWLLENKFANTTEKDCGGNNVFLRAALCGNLTTMKWLVEQFNEDVILAKNDLHRTAVLVSAATGQLDIIQWMYERFGNQIITDHKDLDGNSVLMFASCWGHCELVRWLLRMLHNNCKELPESVATDMQAANNNGTTAIELAAYGGHLPTFKLLLMSGPVSSELVNKALLIALQGRSHAIVDWAIEHSFTTVERVPGWHTARAKALVSAWTKQNHHWFPKLHRVVVSLLFWAGQNGLIRLLPELVYCSLPFVPASSFTVTFCPDAPKLVVQDERSWDDALAQAKKVK